MGSSKTLATLVGGGPAPGINSVISAAAIEAINSGFRVVGVPEGFRHLMRGDIARVRELTIDNVSRIHLSGGSVLGTGRDNPAKSEDAMAAVISSLDELGVTHLTTIGGDDTALSSNPLAQVTQGRLRTPPVPQTNRNDPPLPEHIPTLRLPTPPHRRAQLV